jgi:hypothetical protein
VNIAQILVSVCNSTTLKRSLVVVGGLLLLSATGCATLRGRADDALKEGDYARATDLYTKVLAEHPNDPEVKKRLMIAERGLLDQKLDAAANAEQHGNYNEGMSASLEALRVVDRMHPGSIDEPRKVRVDGVITWSTDSLRNAIKAESSKGHALQARARKDASRDFLARHEFAQLVPEIDAEIAGAGMRTCQRASEVASQGEQPFALEIVASYCKELGGPMPAWKPRPFVVSGLNIRGTINGTPADERAELERTVTSALQRSVWWSPVAQEKATVDLSGSVTSNFSSQPMQLSRSWVERVAYEAPEVYREPIQVPYTAMESFNENVPYTAYETHYEPCPPRGSSCAKQVPVTKYRLVTKTRPVTRYRTDWVERTRMVTRYRDEPRVFTYNATKHSGSYHSNFVANVQLGAATLQPVTVRDAKEDGQVAFEHDNEFAPANVHPESGAIPTALSWRQAQRERLGNALKTQLDAGWVNAFCSEASNTGLEPAARCAHARPKPAPNAVRAQLAELFNGDNPDLVLALPRPKEGVQ